MQLSNQIISYHLALDIKKYGYRQDSLHHFRKIDNNIICSNFSSYEENDIAAFTLSELLELFDFTKSGLVFGRETGCRFIFYNSKYYYDISFADCLAQILLDVNILKCTCKTGEQYENCDIKYGHGNDICPVKFINKK